MIRIEDTKRIPARQALHLGAEYLYWRNPKTGELQKVERIYKWGKLIGIEVTVFLAIDPDVELLKVDGRKLRKYKK